MKDYKNNLKEIVSYLEVQNRKEYNHFELFYMFCDLSDNSCGEFTLQKMKDFCIKYNLDFNLYKNVIENK